MAVAQGIGFLQRFDYLQVTLEGEVEGGALNFLLDRGIGFESQRLAFEKVLAAPGSFLGFRRGCSGGLALALAALPPLDELAT